MNCTIATLFSFPASSLPRPKSFHTTESPSCVVNIPCPVPLENPSGLVTMFSVPMFLPLGNRPIPLSSLAKVSSICTPSESMDFTDTPITLPFSSHNFAPKTKLFTSFIVVFWDVCYNLYLKSWNNGRFTYLLIFLNKYKYQEYTSARASKHYPRFITHITPSPIVIQEGI